MFPSNVHNSGHHLIFIIKKLPDRLCMRKVAVGSVVENVVEMILTRHLSRVIHLTPFAKNDGLTDIVCSVCSGGRNFFSLVELMVEKLVVDECFFFCCGKYDLWWSTRHLLHVKVGW